MPAKKSETEDQPQLKDQGLYDRLREEGNSKEKAARISNAAAKKGEIRSVGRVENPDPTRTGRSTN